MTNQNEGNRKMTKKNSTTITKADLEKAGVTNFQVSKDEFFNLLILAMGEQLEARYQQAENDYQEHCRTYLRIHGEQKEQIFEYLKTLPMVKKLLKIFPKSELVSTNALHNGYDDSYDMPHRHTIAFQDKEDRDIQASVTFVHKIPRGVTKGFAEKIAEFQEQDKILKDKRQKAFTDCHKFHETSKRRLKTQLLRKILTSAEDGRKLITKIEANAADLVSSLDLDEE